MARWMDELAKKALEASSQLSTAAPKALLLV
jgi:hypothetical protein